MLLHHKYWIVGHWYLYIYVCVWVEGGSPICLFFDFSCAYIQDVGCVGMGKYGKLSWDDLVYRKWHHIGEEEQTVETHLNHFILFS